MNTKKIFSRDTNILPQMHRTSNIFGHSILSYNYLGFLGIIKLSNPQLQQNGMPEKCLDAGLV